MSDPRDIEKFIGTMPARYVQTFGAAAIVQHARTSHARGARAVNLGLFDSPGHKGTALCVVAPDRPGLLAITTLAFVNCGLDVIEAEVFTRRDAEACDEAVDLFWVRRQPPHATVALKPADIRWVRDTLTGLLRRAPKELLPPATIGSTSHAATGTLVRFLEGIDGKLATLEIETADKTGLMFGVCQALFNERIQIVGSRITTQNGRVRGRFEIAELSELPIEQSRRHVIKFAILSAVDSLSVDAVSLMVS